jgi:transcriptional accessory protein Tex/SPT6
LNEALLPDVGLPNGRRSTTAIDIAADGLWRRLSKDNEFREKIVSQSDTKRILRAALLGGREDARKLVGLFCSPDGFDEALEDIIREHFGLSEYKLR